LHMECIYPVLYMYHIFCIIHIIQTIYVTYLIRNICSYWRAYAYMPTSTSIVPLQWVSLTGSVHTQKTLFKCRSLVVNTDISSNLFFVWMSLLTNQQCVCATFHVELPDPILLTNTRTHTQTHTNTRTYAHTHTSHTHTYTHINTHQQRVCANFDVELPHPILLRFEHAWCRHDNAFP